MRQSGPTAAGDAVDDDEDGDPRADDDPAVVHASDEQGVRAWSRCYAGRVTECLVGFLRTKRVSTVTVGTSVSASDPLAVSTVADDTWPRRSDGVTTSKVRGTSSDSPQGPRPCAAHRPRVEHAVGAGRRRGPVPERVRNIGAEVAVGDWVVASADGERVEHVLGATLGVRAPGLVRRCTRRRPHPRGQHRRRLSLSLLRRGAEPASSRA